MNFYEIIKTKKLGRGFPDYWTQLFAEHVGGKGEWKVAGVLPLTFTAKGGTAADWTIYGNDDVGENLFDGTIVQGVWNSSTGQVSRIVSSSTRLATSTMLAVDATETYNLKIFSATSDTLVLAIKLLNSAKEQISDTGWVGVSTSISGADYIVVNIRKFDESVITPADAAGITITKGSTAPDHYIPYQQGVGERTENLFDGIEQGSWGAGNFIKENSNTRCRSSNVLDITKGQKYTIHCETTGSVTGKVLFQFKTNTGSSVGESGWLDFGTNGNNTVTAPAAATKTTLLFGLLNNVNCTPSDFANIMLVKGSTAPSSYVPYGYEIPISVNNTPQTFYIGNSPLTAGQSISKTSTGVDIELFEGENTVSTTLYNKPTMEIKYIKRR